MPLCFWWGGISGGCMDFFEYANLTQELAWAFNMSVELWVSLLVGGICFLVIYVFQTVGLYTIAAREGFTHKWMAFVPFFNTYYIGVCGQKNKFFNLDTRKVALVAAILEAVLFCGYVLYFSALVTVSPYIELLETRDIGMNNQVATQSIWGLPDSFSFEHPSLAWAGWCYNYLNTYILNILELIYLFILVVVLNCFFQTYSARHYFLFTIACILFPIQGIMIFVVRHNKAMNYGEYMRRVQEQAYRQYRSQQNYYQNSYNNPYDGNPYSGQQPPRNPSDRQERGDEPFSEYGNPDRHNDDPFEEFKN